MLDVLKDAITCNNPSIGLLQSKPPSFEDPSSSLALARARNVRCKGGEEPVDLNGTTGVVVERTHARAPCRTPTDLGETVPLGAKRTCFLRDEVPVQSQRADVIHRSVTPAL